jgi:CRISPR-associated endonuclease/helicase Cas3
MACRLFLDFIQGKIPEALDVPTGLGKTSVMGIWLAARALGSPVPRRLVYVVDRRAVVDQASSEAERLANNLVKALAGAVAADFAEKWRANLGLNQERLPISTLRGQFADNGLWLENPTRSAIVVGTVDMIGSRMLFEGYGVGSRMRPVHAALIANDTLLVLDEAHLVPPFRELVREVTRSRRPAPVPEMRFMALSATGSMRQNESAFRIEPGDESDETPVRDRLNAPKRLLLHDTANLAQSLADRAFELGKGGRRVLIFCNSRDKLARVVAEELRKRSVKEWKDTPTTVLLVGARRVAEREFLAGRRGADGAWEIPPNPVFRRFLPREPQEPTEIPAFLVATSAGEVGVDLDADHMVCDLVAWERMVQRLGRVNRSGRSLPAIVDVFAAVAKDDVEDDVTEQLDMLRAPFESPVWPIGGDGRRQAGPGALRDLQENPQFAALSSAATTPEPLRPELIPALVEAWAMTSLENHTGRPKVEPWLRGWVEQVPQGRVVWRSVLPVRDGEKPDVRLLNEFFEVLPPHLTETLETETYRIAEVLKARSTAVSKLLGNVETSGSYKALIQLAAVVLNDRGTVVQLLSLNDLKKAAPDDFVGETVVVDARLGGLSPDGLLDSSASETPSTLDCVGEETPLWDEARLTVVGRRLRIVPLEAEPVEGWVREAGWPNKLDDGSESLEEWRVERVLRALTEGDAARLQQPQALKQHLEWAVEEADRITCALGLSDEFRCVVRTAAALHDSGKDRELWQNVMGAPRNGRPFAKTDGRRAYGRALGGYRHEFGSLRDAEPVLSGIEDESVRDLARHMIAAHHGFARPVIPPIDPADPPSLASGRSKAAALRFASLQREWGPWGLAWWEILLRAADWAASARSAATRQPGDNC